MKRPPKMWIGGIAATVACFVLLALVMPTGPLPAPSAKADPPADQTYTGSKRCASCHFDQFLKWKKSGHSKGFEMLTAKYQTNGECLKCHTTGYGEETGFKDFATTPALAGITCESCHGPGSKHDEIAQQFKNVAKLSPEQEQMVRGSIWKMLPKNVCVDCHSVQAHKESQTPPEMRKP